MAEKDTLIGSKIQAKPKEPEKIGVDVDNTLAKDLLDAAMSSTLDLSVLDNFTTVAQTREQIYQLIDTMSSDSTIASILETYAEDACETNDQGQVVWCESADSNVAQYVSFLLDSMNVDKHMYSWIYNLIKYGDVYLKLFKESEYGNDVLFNSEYKPTKKLNEDLDDKLEHLDDKEDLNEDVTLKLYKDNDHYVNYVEAVKNPGEMFELTRFGKTMGYIKAPVLVQNTYELDKTVANINDYTQYKMRKRDVTVYQATDFVHAAMEDNSSRTAEEIDIYTTDSDYENETNNTTYSVKRGQSLLYNVFKIWRQWKLLENSIMLNRITKSSIVRLLQIEVGDMPKEKVRDTLRQVKQMVEQKSALNTGSNFSEYTNPGAVENTIYIPTKGEIGKIQVEEMGAESPDPKSLADLEYFRDEFFAAMRIPKQFFGFTDDSTGFNGGTSLTIISSRYGKAIKRIQNTILQALTDAVNLMLLDRGLNNYVNKFTLRMQAPLTQEVLDRRQDAQNEIGVIRDLASILNENIDDTVIRLKLLKELLSTSTQNPDIVALVQEAIDELETGVEEEIVDEDEEVEEAPDMNLEVDEETTGGEDINLPTPGEAMGNSNEEKPTLTPIPTEEEGSTFGEAYELNEDDDYLPSFAELGIEDGSDTTQF